MNADIWATGLVLFFILVLITALIGGAIAEYRVKERYASLALVLVAAFLIVAFIEIINKGGIHL